MGFALALSAVTAAPAPAAGAGPASVGDGIVAPKGAGRVRVHRFPATVVRRRSITFKVWGVNPHRVVGAAVILHRPSRHRHLLHRRVGRRHARGGARRGRLRVRMRVPRSIPRSGGRRAMALVKTVGPPRARPGTCVEVDSFGGWPAGCWRPYSDLSPFNRPLPADPRIAADSAGVVRRLTGWGEAQPMVVGHPEGSDADYSHPVYYARPSDPTYTVNCTRWASSCEIDGMRVHIPAGARPAGGGDGHMAVIDRSEGWEYDFWQVHTTPLPGSGGVISVSHGGRTPWGTEDATGLGSNATAAHFALDAGVIRAEEWASAAATGSSIDHALFMTVKCSGGYSVYPADQGTTAASCASFGSRNENAPPVGAHFYLDLSDAQINALAVPAWKKPILKAMAHYGLYVGDTFANHDNSFGLMTESDEQYRALGEPGRFAALGRRWDVGTWNGAYVFDVGSGVNWAAHLKMLDPCVAQGTC